MKSKQRLLRHPGLAPLWRSIEREQRQQQVAAVGVVLGGLLLVGFTLGRGFFWPFVGALIATAGLYWLLKIVSEQPLAALREQLRDYPETIVWVYGLLTERMPFGLKILNSATLYLIDGEGEAQAFDLPAKELKLVTKTLNRLLPHAEFGYTKERELKYRGELTRFRGWKNNDNDQFLG